MTIKVSLFYDSKSDYSASIPELNELLRALNVKRGVEFDEVPREEMTDESESALKEAIYRLQLHPGRRGSIVTSRGNMLPLTGTKELNLGNTPILLVEENGKPLDVLPKRVQGHHTSVKDGLLSMIEDGLHFDRPIPSVENLGIAKIVARPQAIEDGLEIIGQEVNIAAGKIDLLAKDRNQKFLVIEFKREAKDASIGQVVRLSAGLAEKEKVPPKEIRKMIVCGRMNDHLRIAAKSADIEVRILPSIFSKE